MNDLIEDSNEPKIMHKRATEGSRYAEKLILSFLRSNADCARVKVENTPYSIDKLYELCRSVVRKKSFRIATVSKNDGKLMLYREKRL